MTTRMFAARRRIAYLVRWRVCEENIRGRRDLSVDLVAFAAGNRAVILECAHGIHRSRLRWIR